VAAGLAKAGRTADALALVDQLENGRFAGDASAYARAAIAAALGDVPGAVRLVQGATGQYDDPHWDPAFDDIRDDPRVVAVTAPR